MTTLATKKIAASMPLISYESASPAAVYRLEGLLRSFDPPPALPGLHRDDPLSWRVRGSNVGDIDGFVVARLGSEIVGGGGIEIYGESAVLRSLTVDPRLLGRGIGSTIVSLLLARAEQRGVRDAYAFACGGESFWRRWGFYQKPLSHWSDSAQLSWQFQLVSSYEYDYLQRGLQSLWRRLGIKVTS
jgi:N-acetylglutamate synthase-like GNAT family acetyltransferase